MIVPDQLTRATRRFPTNVAAICGDEVRSFAEMDERSNRLANALLSMGLSKGDRVATLLENSVRCLDADFALAKSGLVRVSLNPRCTAKEIGYIVADSGARAIVFGSGYVEEVERALPQMSSVEHWIKVVDAVGGSNAVPALDFETLLANASPHPVNAQINSEDLYCLFYTSGTTGKPKGVMLSHRSILHVSFNLLMDVGPQTAAEKILLMQPMSHGAGFFALPWMMKGGCAIIMRQFDPVELLRLVRHHRIETVKLIPTMLQRVLRVPDIRQDDYPWLRQIIYGASPMPIEALKDAINKFGSKLVQIYGQSEAPVTIGVLELEDHDPDGPNAERLGSAGRPWETIELKILDKNGQEVAIGEPGEVVLRAPHLMSGYWKRPDLTAEAVRNGWLHTKDLGRMDRYGYIYLLGRTDEMIISGGYNIAPREIEEVIYQHPGVQEAAVVGEADPEWGQAVVAYVVFRDATGENELLEFLKPTLGYKRPKRIYRLNELPKNSNGKIQKTALKPDLAL